MRRKITKEEAEEILSRNGINRVFSVKAIDALAFQMRKGLFVYNGEAIIISDDNQLLDGQHRLMACVKSGVTIDVELVTGVPKVAMNTIDTGRARTAGDILSMNNIKHSRHTASIIRVYSIEFEKKNRTKISPNEILRFHNEYENEITAVVNFSMHLLNTGTKIITTSQLGGMLLLFSRQDFKSAVDFFRELISDVSLRDSNSAKKLRQKLINDKLSTKRIEQRAIVNYIIKSFNYYRENKSITVLKIGSSDIIEFKSDGDIKRDIDMKLLEKFL